MPIDEEYDLLLRDRLAIAALPSIIQRFTEKVSNSWIKEGKTTEDFEKNAEQIALMAYKVADAMRKARLQAFT